MEWNTLLSEERRRANKKAGSISDHRSEFEKDYHRIILSASFRRLQDKTQVFPLDKSDFIRTRLTHSMEVSSIAKSLGQAVGARLKSDNRVTNEQAGQIEDILLCSGLLHDIGNPPFGHFGETIIRDWFIKNLSEFTFQNQPITEWLSEEMKEDLYHFEGNAQSLRVITKLHYLVDDNGMNLTNALLNTIIKYPVSSTEINKKSGDIRTKKMGYFYADKENFHEIISSTGAGNKRHPLVYLLEAADDIAYTTADIEDGFKKGIISFTKLKHLMENNHHIDQKETHQYSDCEYAIKRLDELFLRGMKNYEPDAELYAVQNWVVTLQGMMIRAVTESFLNHYEEIMAGNYQEDLFAGTKSEVLSKVLKETAFENIFSCSGIVKLEIAADSILSFLLEEFVSAAINYDTDVKIIEKDQKLMELISPNYKRIYRLAAQGKEEGEKLYLRMLLVTDYISGMTDHFAKSLYQELHGIY